MSESNLPILATYGSDHVDLCVSFQEINNFHLETAKDPTSLEKAFFMVPAGFSDSYIWGLVVKCHLNEVGLPKSDKPYCIVYEDGETDYMGREKILAHLWATFSVPTSTRFALQKHASKLGLRDIHVREKFWTAASTEELRLELDNNVAVSKRKYEESLGMHKVYSHKSNGSVEILSEAKYEESQIEI